MEYRTISHLWVLGSPQLALFFTRFAEQWMIACLAMCLYQLELSRVQSEMDLRPNEDSHNA